MNRTKKALSKQSAWRTIRVFALVGLSLLIFNQSAKAETIKSHQVPAVVDRLVELYGIVKAPSGGPGLQQKDPLGYLLDLQRQHWSQAWVSSTFYDWRTLSRYRSQAGLHLGYDIALPFGTPVSNGWEGIVTSIAPWGGGEYGITITQPGGMSVTYGHLTPLVAVGQRVVPGTVLGRVASDHVDIKMRDASGHYVPFGESSQGAHAASVWHSPLSLDKRSLLTAWLVAKTSLDQAEEQLFLRQNASQKHLLEKRAAQRSVASLEATLTELDSPKNEGLVSRKRLEEYRNELDSARAKLESLANLESYSLDQLNKDVRLARDNLNAVSTWARSQGLNWVDVENLVAVLVKQDQDLNRTVVQEKAQRSHEVQKSLETLEESQKRGAERLERLEELFRMGGLSQKEIEDARLRQQLLDEEVEVTRRRVR